MGKLAIFIGPVIAILWLYCVVNVITSRDDEVRHLPKVWWLLIVLFFPLAGSVAWLAAGRPASAPRRSAPYERAAPDFPEYDRPGRAAAADPEADAEFLRKVRERAEEQRRKAREQKRREEPGGADG
ncbi:PLD nuclease N-terminal domain-containing protein [Nocardioides speluncae]|uniref:PLD nuclease N-terminal domain-containing protein n=1 Tax=Nocardioides speluncae TaxID=2670337 RepID=UPI000D69F4B7|nr:PLD nuclease N-terminal domain-containing protein [Nocardioides speluncae]